MIIVPIAFSKCVVVYITRMELHRSFKMLLNKENTAITQKKPKEQTHAVNYTSGKPVQNASEEL